MNATEIADNFFFCSRVFLQLIHKKAMNTHNELRKMWKERYMNSVFDAFCYLNAFTISSMCKGHFHRRIEKKTERECKTETINTHFNISIQQIVRISVSMCMCWESVLHIRQCMCVLLGILNLRLNMLL